MGADTELVGLMGPQLELLLPVLDERARRLALGAVARAAGEGGVTAVAKLTRGILADGRGRGGGAGVRAGGAGGAGAAAGRGPQEAGRD